MKRTTMHRLHHGTPKPLSGNRKVPQHTILFRGTQTDNISIKRKGIGGDSLSKSLGSQPTAEGFLHDAIRKTSVNVSFFGHFYAMGVGRNCFWGPAKIPRGCVWAGDRRVLGGAMKLWAKSRAKAVTPREERNAAQTAKLFRVCEILHFAAHFKGAKGGGEAHTYLGLALFQDFAA